jgi:predicted peroxiredoxin
MTKLPEFMVTLSRNDDSAIIVAFTVALAATTKGQTAAVLLMTEAVQAAKKGRMEGMDIGEPFYTGQELLETYQGNGGRILVCGACATFNKLTKDDLLPECEWVAAGDVVDLMQVKANLQL